MFSKQLIIKMMKAIITISLFIIKIAQTSHKCFTDSLCCKSISECHYCYSECIVNGIGAGCTNPPCADTGTIGNIDCTMPLNSFTVGSKSYQLGQGTQTVSPEDINTYYTVSAQAVQYCGVTCSIAHDASCSSSFASNEVTTDNNGVVSVNTDIIMIGLYDICLGCSTAFDISTTFNKIFTLTITCPPTITIINPGTLSSSSLVYEIDGGNPTFPVVSYSTDNPQCPVLSYDLRTDQTSATVPPNMLSSYVQASLIDFQVLSTHLNVPATYNFYVKITATGGATSWASDTSGNQLFTLDVVCGSATAISLTESSLITPPIILSVLIGSASTNIYTVIPPDRTIACPYISTALESISSSSSIIPQLPSGCVQPCYQVDLSGTSLLSVITFKVRTTVQGGTFHDSSLITINIICDGTSTTITSSIVSPQTEAISKFSSSPNNRVYFGEFICSQPQCCQSLTYTVSSTNSVASPSAHGSFTSVQWDPVQSKYYTEATTSTIQTFSIYIHAINVYGTAEISPLVTVDIRCGPGSTTITEQPFAAGFSSTQIVQHNSPTLTRFMIPSFSNLDPLCPISNYFSSSSGASLVQPASNFLLNGQEDPVGSGNFYVIPQDISLHQEYTFWVKVVSTSTDSVFSSSYNLIVGCTPSASITEDLGFVKTYTFWIGGASQFTFNSPAIDRAYCPILSHQISNLMINGLASPTSSEAQLNLPQPNNQVIINHGNNEMQISFNIKTIFEGSLIFTSSQISVDIKCQSTTIDGSASYDQKGVVPQFFFESVQKDFITFNEFICQYPACCQGQHKLVYTISSVNTNPPDQSSLFYSSVSQAQTAGQLLAQINPSKLGAHQFYIHASNDLGDFAISGPFSLNVNYNCREDKIFIDPNSEKESEAPQVIVTQSDNQPSVKMTFKTTSMLPEYRYDLKNWFIKYSPEGFCEIIDYRIQKVKKGDLTLSRSKYEKFFSMRTDGEFHVLDFSTAFNKYQVFIEVFNNFTWQGFESPLVDISIKDVYVPNYPPFFESKPKPILIDMNDPQLEQQIVYRFPEVVEVNKGDTWSIKVENLDKTYMKFHQDQGIITMNTESITDVTPRIFFLKLKIEDNSGDSTEYSIQISIIRKKVIQEEKKVVVEKEPEIRDDGRIVKARIESLSAKGELKIKFNTDMKTYFNHTFLNSTFVDIYVDPFLKIDEYREINGTQLNFTWNVTRYYKKYLDIQLNFTQPIQLSPYIEQDTLVFHIKNKSFFFISDEYNKDLNRDYFTLRTKIRKQMANTQFTQSFIESSDTMNTALKGGLIFSGLQQFFSKAASQAFIRLIRCLQIIIHLPMLRIVIPANVSVFYEFIITLVMFDLVDPDYSTKLIFDFDEEAESELNYDQMQNIGYETDNSFLNLGSLAFVIVLLLAQVIVLMFLKPLSMKFVSLRKFYTLYHYKVFFSMILAVSIEGYIEFLISGVLSISYNSQFSLLSDLLGVILGYIIVASSVIIVPVSLFRMILLSIDEIQTYTFQQRFGPLTSELKFKSKWTISFYIFFTTRRMILVLITFWLDHLPQFQLIIATLNNLAIMIYQGLVNALDTREKNNIELFNEWAIMTATVSFMCFTDFNSNLEAQTNVGWNLLGLIILVIAVNLYFVIKKTLQWLLLLKDRYWPRFKIMMNNLKQKFIKKNEPKIVQPETKKPKLKLQKKLSIIVEESEEHKMKENESHGIETQQSQNTPKKLRKTPKTVRSAKQLSSKSINAVELFSKTSIKPKYQMKIRPSAKIISIGEFENFPAEQPKKKEKPLPKDNPYQKYDIIIEGSFEKLKVNGYFLNQIDEVELQVKKLQQMRIKNRKLRDDTVFMFQLEKMKLILETMRRHM